MTTKTKRLVAAVQQYFTELRMIRASGGGTDERSNYVPLVNLLNAVGKTLKPKEFGVLELADQGAGHPDLGLYAAHQVRRGKPRPGQRPERGVVEVKSPEDDTLATIVSDQGRKVPGFLRLGARDQLARASAPRPRLRGLRRRIGSLQAGRQPGVIRSPVTETARLREPSRRRSR